MENEIIIVSQFQHFNLHFFLHRPNKAGLGVVYAKFRIGQRYFRVSTNLRALSVYWNDDTERLNVNRRMSRADFKTNTTINNSLNHIFDVVEERVEYYLCDNKSYTEDVEIGKDITRRISNQFKMEKEKKIKKSLLTLLRALVLDYDNKKTQTNLNGIIKTFARFMESAKIVDSIDSLNMNTLRLWRNWLVEEDYSVTRAQTCVHYLFTFAEQLERKYDYDFQLNRTKIEPIKDKRTQEEKKNNGIALTSEEIELLAKAELKGKLAICRDMFLLQCWCGCRVEDLPLLLSSRNLSTDTDGITYSTFVTQKKGITSIIPLNSLFPEALKLVEKYADKCPINTGNERSSYNYFIRRVAKLVGLDRQITYTGQKGGKKYTEIGPLYGVVSSHSGRHTFITNCIRDKGLTPDKVKIMSGHTDTKMIESVYANLTKEDNRKVLKEAIRATQEDALGKHKAGAKKAVREQIKGHSEGVVGFSQSPVEFALWLAKVLGIENVNSLSLTELINIIAEEKRNIIEKFGEKRYEQIKKFLGVGMGQIDRQRLEVLFSRALKRKITLTGRNTGRKL